MGSLKYLLGLSAVRCHLPGAPGLCLPVRGVVLSCFPHRIQVAAASESAPAVSAAVRTCLDERNSSTPPPGFRHLDSLRTPSDRFDHTCPTCTAERPNARGADLFLTVPWATPAQDDFTSPQTLTICVADGELALSRGTSASRIHEPSSSRRNPNGRARRRHDRLTMLRREYERR